MSEDDVRAQRWRRYWDKQSDKYDGGMKFFDRHLFGDTRDWVCRQATGDVLEVAIGTGLDLGHYPAGTRLTGIDLSPAMLQIARDRANDMHLEVDLREGNAHHLDFPDASFDTVVCMFGLCAIPDDRRAVSEMRRVLRPGGIIALGDHIASRHRLGRAIQRLAELLSVPVGGEHFSRRPLLLVQAEGLVIEQRERFGMGGVVERLVARKPL